MIKAIVKDPEVLSKVSEAVSSSDKDAEATLQDLIDTAMSYIDNCLGLAAVQIGVHKRIIVIRSGEGFIPMINPTIVKRSDTRDTMEEGCLSLEGTRKVTRPVRIEIMYQRKVGGKYIRQTVENADSLPFARVIQHEIDHTKGVLI